MTVRRLKTRSPNLVHVVHSGHLLNTKSKTDFGDCLNFAPPFSDKHSFIHIYFSSLPLPEAFFAPELNPSFFHLLPFFSEVSSTPSSTLAGRQMSQPRKSWRWVSKNLKINPFFPLWKKKKKKRIGILWRWTCCLQKRESYWSPPKMYSCFIPNKETVGMSMCIIEWFL